MTTDFELGFNTGFMVAILDGEGCFQLIKGSSPEIRLGSTDLDIVVRTCNIIGHNLLRIGSRVLPSKKIYHYISVGGRDALKLMRLVYPYMCERRKNKIDEIISVVLERRPFFELGPDFCAMKGHSIKYHWEYSINTTGNKQCRRCNGQKIRPPIVKTGIKAVNPFERKEAV
jgi:hypothetical protein